MKKITNLALILVLWFTSVTFSIADESEETYKMYIFSIADAYEISPEFVEALVFCESSFNPNAISDKECIGLGQINPRYHKERMEKLGVTDLYDPYSNILVCVDYLDELFRKYDDPYQVLSVYNSGSTGNSVEYCEKVTKLAEELERGKYESRRVRESKNSR